MGLGYFVRKDQTVTDQTTYLSSRQLAKRLGISVHTLKNWRQKGYGPPFLKLAGPQSRTRYKLADVETWEREHTK